MTAIVSADVVGYSRLMGLDESGTLVALKSHLRELIDPKIAEYGGRTVKSMGDGLLLEFPSIVDAVRCAVDVQRGMAERNAAEPAEQQIQFRVGINVGDIIIDGDDIFGDGVNVAARLQTLAEPGGICVSRGVRDQVLDKLSFTFEDLGPQEVKNIARSLDVYRVDLDAGTGSAKPYGPSRRLWQHLAPSPQGRLFTIVIVTIGLTTVGAWLLPRFLHPAPPSLPPTGSIVVLPFTTPNAGNADEQLADTLTTDLTSALQKGLPWAPVVSHSLAAAYKGKVIDARTIGRELNVRFLVEGDVRTAGGRVVVKAHLIETGKATEVWSDDFDFEVAEVAADRSALVTRMTVNVRAALVDVEARRVLAQPIADLSASDLSLRADAVQSRDPQSPTALAEARKLYGQALRLDPMQTQALMGLALTVAETLDRDPGTDHDRLLQEYDVMSERLVAAAGSEARAWNIRADALQRQWRWEAALEVNARAQKIDPTRPGPYGQRADIMVSMGRPVEALALIDQGLSLQSPSAGLISYLIGSRCSAYMALGRYEDALMACEKQAALSDSWQPHAYLVAAYALQGNAPKAQSEKAKLLTQRPRFSIAEFKARRISDVPAYLEQTEAHFYAGLRKAGIPEQ